MVSVFAVLGFAGAAVAQGDGATIRVQVREQQRDAQGRPDNQPVLGVTVVLSDGEGNELQRGETDDRGVVSFEVPERVEYLVTLIEDTLPEDQTLSSGTALEQRLAADSFTTNTRTVNYFTGESQSKGQNQFERVAQLTANGIQLGLILAMCSVGLSLIFGTTGLTNFAHGEMVTWGALMVFLLNVTGIGFLGFLSFLPLIDDQGRFQILLAAPLAIVLGGAFGFMMDWGIFGRLRRRGIGLITQMVLTVGLAILLRNAYLFQFGGRTRPLRDYTLQEAIDIGPVSVTPRDIVITVLSTLILVAVALALQLTRLGKATRAVSDNVDLARATGIDTQRVIRLVWIAGGGLAALGGVFRGMTEQVGFEMGSNLLFLMFAGITLGGLGSAFGALVGGFLVGLFVELATLVVPSELKNTPALAVLILVLLLRPQGILGKAQRVG
jgi:neutral amino acid transport system permease protein